jgi:hypothetical protein
MKAGGTRQEHGLRALQYSIKASPVGERAVFWGPGEARSGNAFAEWRIFGAILAKLLRVR